MKKRILLAVALASSVFACSSPSTTSPSSNAPESTGGSSTSDPGSQSNTDSTPTLVGVWLGPAIHRAGDQYIDLTTTSSGTGALWWYGGGYATWNVTADDDGMGSAKLTLTCSNTQCNGDAPIVYDCTYTATELSCLGISGGRDNSYDFAAGGRTAPDVYKKQ